MKCRNCNNDNVNDARFCAFCGATLTSAKQPPPFPSHVPSKPQQQRSSNRGVLVAIFIGLFFFGIIVTGIISAIAIPNFLNATQRAKQRQTMKDIRTIAAACEAYAVDHQMYPDAKSIKELQPLIVPAYLKALPVKDAWDRTFAYQSWAKDESQKGPTSYIIVSFGKDGAVDSKHYLENVVTTSFNNDIVFSDGSFWQYPEHSQP